LELSGEDILDWVESNKASRCRICSKNTRDIPLCSVVQNVINVINSDCVCNALLETRQKAHSLKTGKRAGHDHIVNKKWSPHIYPCLEKGEMP
jgi:hypothetical protein